MTPLERPRRGLGSPDALNTTLAHHAILPARAFLDGLLVTDPARSDADIALIGIPHYVL